MSCRCLIGDDLQMSYQKMFVDVLKMFYIMYLKDTLKLFEDIF